MVDRGAFGQQLTDPGFGIGNLQQGPRPISLHAAPNDVGRNPETNHQGVLFQTGEMRGIRPHPPTGGKDRVAIRIELGHQLSLKIPKPDFPFLVENLADTHTGARLDERIGIDKTEVQLPGHQAPDRGFARAHETNQGQIADLPRFAHGLDCMQLPASGTQFLFFVFNAEEFV
jgi:hypothetical protein